MKLFELSGFSTEKNSQKKYNLVNIFLIIKKVLNKVS